MGHHIRRTYQRAQVQKERTQQREKQREIEAYMCVYMRLWTHLYGRGCMAGIGGGVSYINKHRTATKDGRELLIKG